MPKPKGILRQLVLALHNDKLGGDPWYVESAIEIQDKPHCIRVQMRDGKIATLQLKEIIDGTHITHII